MGSRNVVRLEVDEAFLGLELFTFHCSMSSLNNEVYFVASTRNRFCVGISLVVSRNALGLERAHVL